MHADEHHIFDPSVLQDAPDLFTAVGDPIGIVNDVDRRDLTLPRMPKVAAFFGQLLLPGRLFLWRIVFAACRLVDRINRGFLGRNLMTPLADVGRKRCRSRGLDRAAASGMVAVSRNTVARRMNDRRAVLASGGEEAIDRPSQFRGSFRRAVTVMRIPHVSDDHGRFGGVPLLRLRHGVEAEA